VARRYVRTYGPISGRSTGQPTFYVNGIVFVLLGLRVLFMPAQCPPPTAPHRTATGKYVTFRLVCYMTEVLRSLCDVSLSSTVANNTHMHVERPKR